MLVLALLSVPEARMESDGYTEFRKGDCLRIDSCTINEIFYIELQQQGLEADFHCEADSIAACPSVRCNMKSALIFPKRYTPIYSQ